LGVIRICEASTLPTRDEEPRSIPNEMGVSTLRRHYRHSVWNRGEVGLKAENGSFVRVLTGSQGRTKLKFRHVKWPETEWKMERRGIWLVASCLMVAALVLASCGPAAVEEKEEAVVEEEAVEEEVEAPPPEEGVVEEEDVVEEEATAPPEEEGAAEEEQEASGAEPIPVSGVPIVFEFSEVVVPAGSDRRNLAVAFHSIRYLDADGNTIEELIFGTSEANTLQEEGWFGNEEWSDVGPVQWTGGPSKKASMRLRIPEDTVRLQLKVNPIVEGMWMDVTVDGELVERLGLCVGWHLGYVPIGEAPQTATPAGEAPGSTTPTGTGPQVDASTLDQKVLFGYQGWFGCPEDGSRFDGWVHWFKGNTPTASEVRVDFWPDISELTEDELFATDMTLPDGSPAMVFSSYTEETVVRHFRWMEEYGIDGVFSQRFIVGLSDPCSFERLNQVLQNVRAGAEAHGRVFVVMYDITGSEDRLVEEIKNDWAYLVDILKVTESPNYLHHDGRPVLAIWGPGFTDRNATPEQTMELIDYLQSTAPPEYRVTLIGGVPTHWRTLSGDSLSDPNWAEVYRSFDVISPWLVGRFADEAGADSLKNSVMLPDMAEASASGIEYMPVVWPGFSWHNQYSSYPLNQIPRNGGHLYWRQVYNAISAGATMLYVAMFDEVDEGTAMFKLAPTAEQIPAQGFFVPLDTDGYALPSDWYLRLGGETGRALRGEIRLSAQLPLTPE